MKVHTRIKRRHGLTTSFRGTGFFGKKKKENRPKTFKTEKGAHAAAEKKGLKKDAYSLIKVKKNKRFQIHAK